MTSPDGVAMGRETSIPDVVDVVVVGGGPAGSATALRLARTGRSVVVLERSHYDRMRLGETLPPIVNPLIADLGLSDAFATLGPVESHGTASAWGGPEVADRSFVFSPYGSGWHVDRARFDAMLVDEAAAAGGLVVRGARVARAHHDGDAVVVTVDMDDELFEVRTAQVVDATGRTARIARALGARARHIDSLVSVSVVCEPSADAPIGDTLLEATCDGWWYVSPLPGERRIVAFFTDAAIAAKRRLKDAPAWWDALAGTRHTLAVACHGAPLGLPRVASAASHVLTPALGSGWIAVGDAALAVDPLSSGGVAFALRSAEAAAAQIVATPGRVAGSYEAMVAEAADRYLIERADHYGLEDRFRDEPFWSARRAPEHVLATTATP